MTLFIIGFIIGIILGFISSLREYKTKVKDELKEELKDEKEVNNKKLSNKKIYKEKCGHKFSEEEASNLNFVLHERNYQKMVIEKKDGIYWRYYCEICGVYWEEKFKKINPN